MLPISRFDVFEDMFSDSFFAKKESYIMRTDKRECDGNYILDIDIPGCEKENIKIELNNGILNVSATITHKKNNPNEENNYIHKERFHGECCRKFYVGENLDESDIKASFKNGILTITFPKESIKQEENKKYIEISD